MKLILKTVYENFDQDWFDWYLKELETSGIEAQERVARNFRAGTESVSFTSTHEGVDATTSYELIK